MTKLIRALNIAIDLRAIVDRDISTSTDNLFNYSAWKGSLGGITVLSEAFDLHLLMPISNIQEDEIMRFLKAAQIENSFRRIIKIDENVKNSLLQHAIHVTITPNKDFADQVKDISKVYFIRKKHDESILDQIQKVSQWREIVRDVALFSSNE